MNRHRAVGTVSAALVALVVVAGCSSGGDASGNPSATVQASTGASASSGPEYFYSLSAEAGSARPASDDGDPGETATVTLTGVAPVTVAITERPRRQTSRLSTPEFVDGWTDTFGDDPPNASLGVIGDGGHQHEASIEILHAEQGASSGEVSFDVAVLAGDLPEAFSDASLVIDNAGGGVQLNLINRSSDTNQTDVLVFQENQAAGSSSAVAWQVIENLGQLDNHPFTFGSALTVSASDSYGNAMPTLQASPGDTFEVTRGAQGDQLSRTSSSGSGPITVTNSLEEGSIDADILRTGHVLGSLTDVDPGSSAEFEFDDTIWIGVVSQVEQGEVLNSAIRSQVTTQLDLSGISSADIAMTGGGPGTTSEAFEFKLENVDS